jgi:hypothetical protein
MMEAARSSETSVNFYQTTRCYNPEDSHLRTNCRKNLKSYVINCIHCVRLYSVHNIEDTKHSSQVVSSNALYSGCTGFNSRFVPSIFVGFLSSS